MNPNRLAQETSAYLKSAEHQPIDWHPWGDEPFRLAAEQRKPVLLDIGAVWCHWCHVMDRESYEDPEVAAIINDRFIAVKVDRDERPEVDRRYQTAVGAITGQGGWPLTAFLTERGQVFYGGTYFPKNDMHGRPGYKSLLARVSDLYRDDKNSALENARKIKEHLGKLTVQAEDGHQLRDSAIDVALESIGQGFDIVHGGFGRAPKFPHTSAIELALARYYVSGEDWLNIIINKTLEKMALGGVYDQLGGGFHRYSVDERWIVPHFEKMSYDNSELLRNYVHGFQATGKALFREAAEGIVRWVAEVASDPDRGGFYASQDADVGLDDDGDYFTWTVKEVEEALSSEDAQIISLHYNVEPRGEMHHNPAKNVLFVDSTPEAIARLLQLDEDYVCERIAAAKQTLFEARALRPVPYVDKTVYSGWNGMMASAHLEAFKGLGTESCKVSALKALDRLIDEAYKPGRGFYHSLVDGEAKVDGLLDDQIHMARALIDAHEATSEPHYLALSQELMDFTIQHFWDDIEGGFFDLADFKRGSVGLEEAEKPIQDSPTPGTNSVAALTLDRLYYLTHREEFRDKAEQTLKLFGPTGAQYGLFASTYFLALEQHLNPPAHAVIVGPDSDPLIQSLWKKALATYRPHKLVSLYDPDKSDMKLLPPAVQGMMSRDTGPQAYVCAGNACALPTDDPEVLEANLKTFGLQPR